MKRGKQLPRASQTRMQAIRLGHRQRCLNRPAQTRCSSPSIEYCDGPGRPVAFCVGAFVGQGKAGGMSQHMRMHLERYPCLDPCPLDQFGQARGGERCTALQNKDEGRLASRFRARNARNSSPSNGWVPVAPPLARRRCRVPDSNSTSDHCRRLTRRPLSHAGRQ